MIIGGKTHFITAAQGMPTKYEAYLLKRKNTYLPVGHWPPPVTAATMSNPHSKGSLKVLNLKVRNKAIRIMKLKKLTDHSTSCPLASEAALEIILTCTQQQQIGPSPHGPILTDIFLQSFIKCKCFMHKQLPHDLKAILSSGTKHNLTLDFKHKLNLPAWFHPRKETNIKNCEHRLMSWTAPGCVTRHTRHASVTHFRPILGKVVEVTLISVAQDQVRQGGPEVHGLTQGQTQVNGH